MAIIINKETRVVVQGMSGKEGIRAAESMLASGTQVLCGVTPGKGGQSVLDRPMYDSVVEAIAQHPELNLSVLYVPPLLVLDAAMEAMAAGIKTVMIITENVPVSDGARIVEHARAVGCTVVGPSSVGVLNTRLGKIGSIGKPQESKMFLPGNVGIISKSGGMCAETALVLTQAGIGQSTIIGIGGDRIIGTSFVDVLRLFEQDEETRAVVVFGEIGGFYETQIAELVANKEFTKPVIAFISGQFAEAMGRSLALGHAGAIIEGSETTSRAKKAALRAAGVIVADYHHQIPELVARALK
jgi:succinyl-CoA synthetase alpha subunit